MQLTADILPTGYFEPADIEFYRWLAERIHPGGRLVELGCHLGRSTCVAGAVLKASGATMICVDNWNGDESVRKLFTENILRFGLEHVVTIITGDSTETAVHYAPKTIDCVFIDADHRFERVVSDIRAWWPTLKIGGTMAGHDYYENPQGMPHCEGVKRAVDQEFGEPEGLNGSCWYVRKAASWT